MRYLSKCHVLPRLANEGGIPTWEENLTEQNSKM